MKKLLKIFLFCCMFSAQTWAQEGYKEYGIVLLLPDEYALEAQKMNREIFMQIPEIENLPNVFHVTVFQGRFAESDVYALYKKLKNQKFKSVRITLTPEIKTAEGRYINWQVQKNYELTNLHNKVVKIANPYRYGMLFRYAVSYEDLSEKQRSQVDKYGMAGVFEEYDPHVTLFYFSEKNPEIDELAEKITPPTIVPLSKTYKASLAIAELGYSGNIEKILYLF